jgi:P27 family predicted phage terminase small subunit
LRPDKVPVHLSRKSKKLWRELNATWEFEINHLLLLQTALECYDLMIQARDLVKDEGIIITAKNGYRQKNPALMIWKDSRAHFFQAWRLIGFDEEPPKDVGRPPLGYGS